ncbi:hypothetical protein U9M48_012317 [Paspalum notatum var. saurae]|uniref:RRM domain-containing protein n=1 Tax=Paspalum notatum var. saurae TaxID=547442 RepID=A0AAQ3SXN7_PASNO
MYNLGPPVSHPTGGLQRILLTVTGADAESPTRRASDGPTPPVWHLQRAHLASGRWQAPGHHPLPSALAGAGVRSTPCIGRTTTTISLDRRFVGALQPSLPPLAVPLRLRAFQEGTSEARMDIGVKKIGSLGNKIRIRLPPRKRLSEGVQIMSTGVPEDTKNYPAKEVAEHTDNSSESTTFVNTKLKMEEVSAKPPGEGHYEEANSNSLCKTMSKDRLCEDHLITTKTESSYPVRKGPCEEGNKNIVSNGPPPEESSNTPKKESCVGVIGNSPSKNIPVARVQDEVEKNSIMKPCEGASKNILNKSLLHETNSNTSMKRVTEEAEINNPSKNLKSAAKCEENGNSVENLFEEDEKNTACVELSTKSVICAPKKRLADPGYDMKSSKKLSTSAVQATETSQKTSGMKVSTSVGKLEEENGNSVENNMFEEDKKNITGVELSTKSVIFAPKKRLADPGYDMKSSKKLCTSAVQATETSQNTSGIKLSTSVGLAMEQSTSTVFLEGAKEYKEFEDKVKRTIYLDSLSLQATDAVIKTALNQFGNVRNVNFLTNYTVPFTIPQSALVEMETEQEAVSLVNLLDEFPFMIAGMPRPVSAKHATVEMFSDRPWKPGRKLEFRWVRPTDPDYHDVRKFKLMCKRHEVENLALIKNQLQQEALLAKHQQDNLNCQYSKLDSMDSIILSGCVDRLTNIYNLSFDEVYRKSQAFMAPF